MNESYCISGIREEWSLRCVPERGCDNLKIPVIKKNQKRRYANLGT